MKQIIAVLVDAPNGQRPSALGKIVDALRAARMDARYAELTVSEETLQQASTADLGAQLGAPLITALAVNFRRPPDLALHPDAFSMVTADLIGVDFVVSEPVDPPIASAPKQTDYFDNNGKCFGCGAAIVVATASFLAVAVDGGPDRAYPFCSTCHDGAWPMHPVASPTELMLDSVPITA